MRGKVWIVGAGPGAADLVTRRGLEALRRADVVLYDRLAAPELLDEAPRAEHIYVGKEPAPRAAQEAPEAGGERISPAREESSPARDGRSPGRDESSGSREESSAACEERAAQREESSPAGEDGADVGEESSPAGEEGSAAWREGPAGPAAVEKKGGRAGESGAPRRRSQDEINELLAEKALAGRRVVRLKGGDPLTFARGAEEADYLRERGVDFEIVPGVTAAAGAAAFAGVPLTDRRRSSQVTLVTGREGEAGSPGVDWEAVARSGGTLVIYMGRGNLAELASKLTAAGLAPETPALVVENATLPSQRCAAGPVSEIAAKAAAAGLEPPSVTIVGAVAAAYPENAWFERLPLFGRKVVVTRPAGQQEGLARALSSLGAEVVRFPTIEVVKAGAAALAGRLGDLDRFDWLVLTSANGVEALFEALEAAGRDARALAGKAVAAVGPATARALCAGGIRADLVPGEFTGDALLGELLEASSAGEGFLLWRSKNARPELAEGLRRAGRAVVEVDAYEVRPPAAARGGVLEGLAADPPAALLFSSSSTARNFVALAGEEAAAAVARVSKVVSIGPVTSAALRELGLPPHSEAGEHTAGGLLETTLSALGAGPAPDWLDAP